MNLGDGLVFELENGKPKLVLAHCGESKASGKMGFCKVPPKNRQLKATAISKLGPKAEERWQRDRKCRDISRGVNHAEHSSRKTKPQSRTDRCSVIGVVRVPSESKTESANETSNVKSIKESLVCLTQEQLQQILNSVKASGQNVRDDSTALVQNGPATQEEETETVTSATGKDQQINSPGKGNAEKTLCDSTPAGLFSTFGEHEQKRNTLEAKKAQWRRELDEQMALKKQQKESAEVLARSEQPRDTEAGPRSSAQLSGEAAPLEHAFSAEKKEQQRRWLQDLEQQREETKLRRKLEKQSQNQPEDHERWAMHFDSFQQRLPVQPPSTAELDLYSALSQYRAPSQALSTAWETVSTCGGDSMGRASVDTTQGCQPKSSYLRTMTALLDPAQIEERERKRVKQLEFQRAIDVQVEERRQQKEKEEATRQIMEQKEELRIAKQRELENLRDTQLQRQKELQARKTEELYLNMQRTSKEVQKHKQLMEKGHDVSNRLRSETTSQALIGQGSESSATLDTITEAPHAARKDTAVQTEINPGSPFPETNGGIRAAVEYKAPPDIKRSRREGRLAEKDSGKENMCAAVKGADPYEAYARTDRTHGRQQLCHRPEWNTQRPGKAFVPASERYPATQQKHRQENKIRRQMELMNLAERNTRSRTPQQAKPPRSGNPSRVQQHSNSPCQKDEDSHRVQSASQISRVPSPPVPAVLRRLQVRPPSCAEEQSESCGRPPSADYVPYVRTDEVYHLDPLAPISRPTTNEGPQRIHADLSDVSSRQHVSPLVQRDPLLHPELLKGTERQQAILKGLSELRQSLLQKQRELETSLGPLLQGQSRTQSSSPPERTTDVGREYDRYTPALYSPQGNTH
ncbi:coiled-coil domain-containing protein 66 isoform X2 [Ictalurus furcatus]|uniref:coiled-coil domain-containing protein 66 isoform X2 n=1 Tax=Ictalurus furcatus TaxID=66913 RepID=UPI002350AC6B|nr:coiled-coil domain-containing protein 66 isoform X2 [Ictalurus furcatus]